jgi:hypothetical protein
MTSGIERHRSADRPSVVQETMLGSVVLSASVWGLTRVRFGRHIAARSSAPQVGTTEK